MGDCSLVHRIAGQAAARRERTGIRRLGPARSAHRKADQAPARRIFPRLDSGAPRRRVQARLACPQCRRFRRCDDARALLFDGAFRRQAGPLAGPHPQPIRRGRLAGPWPLQMARGARDHRLVDRRQVDLQSQAALEPQDHRPDLRGRREISLAHAVSGDPTQSHGCTEPGRAIAHPLCRREPPRACRAVPA